MSLPVCKKILLFVLSDDRPLCVAIVCFLLGGGGGGGGVISRMIIYGPTESMWGCHCGRHDSELNTELFVDLFLLGSQF